MTVEVLSRYAPVPATTVLLDSILTERNAERDKDYKPSGRLSASQLAGCPWAIWASRLELPPTAKPTSKVQRRWHYGRMVEKFIRDTHKAAGTLLAEEVHLIDDTLGIGVSGYIDAVVGGSYGGHDWPISTVMEIKSRMAIQMQYVYREGPYDSEKLQLGCYGLILKRQGWPLPEMGDLLPPPKAFVLTIASGDSGGELDYPMLPKWMDDAEQRIEELSAFLSSDDEPPCQCDTMFMCNPKKCRKAHDHTKGAGPKYCKFAIFDPIADRDDPATKPFSCCGREAAA